MSDIQSSYTIDLVVKDDKTKDSIRELENELGKVGKSLDMEDAQKSVDSALRKIDALAKNTSSDFDAISKAYSRTSQKAVSALEKQYEQLRMEQDKQKASSEQLSQELSEQHRIQESSLSTQEEKNAAQKRSAEIEAHICELGLDQIENKIKQNRQLRYQLKVSAQMAIQQNAIAKSEKKEAELTATKAKLEAAQNKAHSGSIKERIKFFINQRKENNLEIKSLQDKIKLLKAEGKEQMQIAHTVKLTGKSNGSNGADRQGKHQGLFNVASVAGKGVRAVAGAGSAAVGMIGGAISAVTQVAQNDVEKEQQANRVKGYNYEDAKDILGKLYIKTGADYSTIVDAINKVQGTLGRKLSKEDLVSASEVELRYPGTSAMFASSNTESSAGNFNVYANRMRSIQSATGASNEQIQASSQMFSNMKSGNFNNAKVTELQGVYLQLQNSGAFDSQEELDEAFNGFVRKQKESKMNVFDLARNYDWISGIQGERNRVQATNTIKNMDWKPLQTASTIKDDSVMQKTESEKSVEEMRALEVEKNNLLKGLLPALSPIIKELTTFLQGDGAKKLVKGITDMFTTLAPIMKVVFDLLDYFLKTFNDYILENLKAAMAWLAKKFGNEEKDDGKENDVSTDAIPKSANGGLAFGPTLVGERAFQPEMILPLDYSRQARAGNIVQSVSQTFNMSGNETTALSLSQAVKSRDFRRATAQNAFLTARGGLI